MCDALVPPQQGVFCYHPLMPRLALTFSLILPISVAMADVTGRVI